MDHVWKRLLKLLRVAELQKKAYVEEGVFAHGDEVPSVTVDDQKYDVTKVTKEVVAGRAY